MPARLARAAIAHVDLVDLLMRNGFVAAEEEAEELLAAADGDGDRLDAMVRRRLTGEPLAWITGTAPFCGLWIKVDAGVYVPRWQTEALARRAAERLPERGSALDLCTGSGAIAAFLMHERPGARVVATDVDPRAVANARRNGVDAHEADLFAGGRFDVITGVVPYVPTPDLPLLQRDTFTFESALSYDGGGDGLDIARRVVAGAPAHLVPGGALLLELGGRQPAELELPGFADVRLIHDEEGDVRGLEATCIV
jgi:release factor glutamine methyltransferase